MKEWEGINFFILGEGGLVWWCWFSGCILVLVVEVVGFEFNVVVVWSLIVEVVVKCYFLCSVYIVNFVVGGLGDERFVLD